MTAFGCWDHAVECLQTPIHDYELLAQVHRSRPNHRDHAHDILPIWVLLDVLSFLMAFLTPRFYLYIDSSSCD